MIRDGAPERVPPLKECPHLDGAGSGEQHRLVSGAALNAGAPHDRRRCSDLEDDHARRRDGAHFHESGLESIRGLDRRWPPLALGSPACQHPGRSGYEVERHLSQVAGNGVDVGCPVGDIEEREATTSVLGALCPIGLER